MKKTLLYFCLLLLTQCSKCKDNDPTPEEQLPPATQNGANTFGCLVNGQVFTPEGNDGTDNFDVVYDATFNGGNLDVRAYRYPKNGNGRFQDIIMGGDNIPGVGIYPLTPSESRYVSYYDGFKMSPCIELRSADSNVYCKGTLTITRLDVAARIVSGTFSFKLYKPGCDTVRVTNGRFDKKL